MRKRQQIIGKLKNLLILSKQCQSYNNLNAKKKLKYERPVKNIWAVLG